MDEVFAKVFVKPNQSVYLKYLFGIGDNVRLLGDVGLAQDKILIPWWDNITRTQGVRPTADGGVPRGYLARFNREAEGKRSKRSATSERWGVCKGTITLHGQPRLAYIARPPRVPVAIPDTIDQAWEGRERVITTAAGHLKQVGRRMRDIDHPRILFLAVDKATYRPTLQEPWDLACRAAAAGIGMTMARQLSDNVEHARKREAAGPWRRDPNRDTSA